MSGCHHVGYNHVGPCQCICHKPNGKVKCLLCNCREETDISQMKEDIKKLNKELNNLTIKYKINRNVQDVIYSEIEKIKLELKMKNENEIICPHCTQIVFQGSR